MQTYLTQTMTFHIIIYSHDVCYAIIIFRFFSFKKCLSWKMDMKMEWIFLRSKKFINSRIRYIQVLYSIGFFKILIWFRSSIIRVYFWHLRVFLNLHNSTCFIIKRFGFSNMNFINKRVYWHLFYKRWFFKLLIQMEKHKLFFDFLYIIINSIFILI